MSDDLAVWCIDSKNIEPMFVEICYIGSRVCEISHVLLFILALLRVRTVRGWNHGAQQVNNCCLLLQSFSQRFSLNMVFVFIPGGTSNNHTTRSGSVVACPRVPAPSRPALAAAAPWPASAPAHRARWSPGATCLACLPMPIQSRHLSTFI